jgi:eukaryotic-like serine/threonine-protein kinase
VKGFLRAVFLVLVLIAIVLGSALTAMRFAIHGQEVRVPKLIGFTQQAAEQALDEQGLRLNVENRFYSAQVPEGQVLSQYPMPNDKVRRGWRVRVAMSLGVPANRVPDVMGESTRAAEINLRRAGFEPSQPAALPSTGEPDTVIAQSPQASAQAVATPSINLLVAAAPDQQAFVLPSFVGKNASLAAATIRNSGFKVQLRMAAAQPSLPEALPPPPGFPTSAPQPAQGGSGAVLAQSPVAGTKVTHDTAIVLTVAP